MLNSEMPALPEYGDVFKKWKSNEDSLTNIERFIFNNEPEGDAEVEFRADFHAALQEAFDTGLSAAQPAD